MKTIRPWIDGPNRLPAIAATAYKTCQPCGALYSPSTRSRAPTHVGRLPESYPTLLRLVAVHVHHYGWPRVCSSRVCQRNRHVSSTVQNIPKPQSFKPCAWKHQNTPVSSCNANPSFPRNGKRIEGAASSPILRYLELLRWVIASSDHAR